MSRTIYAFGRMFEEAVAPCSCCGTDMGKPDDGVEEEWRTYRAGLVDDDGGYYSYLCGLSDGLNGCLEEIAREVVERRVMPPEAVDQKVRYRQAKADSLREMMGDDEDGIWSEMKGAQQ